MVSVNRALGLASTSRAKHAGKILAIQAISGQWSHFRATELVLVKPGRASALVYSSLRGAVLLQMPHSSGAPFALGTLFVAFGYSEHLWDCNSKMGLIASSLDHLQTHWTLLDDAAAGGRSPPAVSGVQSCCMCHTQELPLLL